VKTPLPQRATPFLKSSGTDASARPADSATVSFCFLQAVVPLETLPSASWTTIQSGQARRDLVVVNQTSYYAFDSLPGLQVTAALPTADSVELVLAGTYADTLRGHRTIDANGALTYAGAWACPVRFPKANDSVLVAHGYDAGLPIQGRWFLALRRLID